MSRLRWLGLLVVALLVGAVTQALGGSPVGAVNAPQSTVVSAVPGAGTPNVSDGRVYAITQVGSTMLIGGSFTQATSANGATTYNQPYVLAFDATTGAVNTAFAPVLDGDVQALLPGPTAGTVYVGGEFNNLDGVKYKGLVLLTVATGARVTTFKAPAMNGLVESVRRVGNRLYVGGTFTTMGGVAHGGLATLNATTGALDPYMASTVTINHSWTQAGGGAKAAVGVFKLDVTPDGNRLVAIGNFKKVDGLDRDQAVMFDTSGSTTAVVRPDWQTHRYEPACYSWAYDTYVRDVDISPDGSYFVISATGGGNGTLCDTAARFEIAGSGTDIQPTWVDYAGGDSLLSVAITGTAVYVGGHQRWLNNPDGNDYANGGAVPRPGIGALDPKNGMPLTWNPGRNPRGAGAYALYASPTGLWVGSDTEWIGDYDYKRGRIAYFPLAGGAPVASDSTGTLPGGVYVGAPQDTSASNVLYRVNAGGSTLQAIDSGPDWTDGSGNVAGGNSAGWSPVPTVRPEVPASTPRAVFDSERWAEQHWTFPVPSGAQVQVRLYFANRYPGTAGVGQRVFNVGINGSTVLPNYDIVADVGNDTGTVKSFSGLTASGDGNLHVDFTPVVENPLINGIELVRTDLPAPPPTAAGALIEHNFDGTAASGTETVGTAPDFSAVRGATLVGNTLYYGKTDSNLYRRTLTGTTFGAEQLVDPYNDPKWSTVSVGGGSSTTFRGVKPTFYSEITNLTSLFYDGKGNLYYTLYGGTALYSRAFSPDSGIVHNHRVTAAAALPSITGAFLVGNTLYYATKADGNLSKVGFANGALTGSPTVLSGPAVDGIDWRSKALFLGPAVAPPVASPIGFRATAGVNGNTASPTLTVPGTVQAGDALTLLVTTKTGTTHTPPAGWTPVSQSSGSVAQTSVWQKVATGADAGSSVAVTLSELTKVDVRLLAYSGTAASSPVSAVVSSDASLTTGHPAPTATVSTPGSWVVWYWADKSSGTTTSWTAPADTITRSSSFGTGTTYISSLVADLDGPSAVGSVPGPTASTNAASRGNEVALVLEPAG